MEFLGEPVNTPTRGFLGTVSGDAADAAHVAGCTEHHLSLG